VALDVLEEAEGWFTKSNTICDPGPEVSGVVFSEPFPGCGEGLAVVNDGTVGAVTLVLVDGDVIDIRNAAGFVAPDVLPSVRAIDSSGCISVWNSEYVLHSLVDNSTFNDCFWFDSLFSDRSNHSESSLSDEGERNSQTSANCGDIPFASGPVAPVSVPAEVSLAQGTGPVPVELKNPSRQMLSGRPSSELSAEFVQFFFDDGEPRDSPLPISIKGKSSCRYSFLEGFGFVVVAADSDSSTVLALWFLPPAVGEVPSDEPPELWASIVLHNVREHLADSVAPR